MTRNQVIVLRVARCLLMAFAFLVGAASAQGETVVLRNGQRLAVTGYERRGDTMVLQVDGGTVEVRAGDILAIEPQEYFPALKTAPQPTLDESIRDAAARHQLDPDFVASVIAVESNFDVRAVSRKNARGLMQLVPGTSQRLAVQDVFDARQNLDGGTRYLRELLDRYGQNASLALAAYNAGPGRVDREGGIPSIAETRRYVARVLREWRKRKAKANSGTAAQADRARKASSSTASTDY